MLGSFLNSGGSHGRLHPHRQRPESARGGPAGHPPALGPARRAGPHGHQVWVRGRPMRGLHREAIRSCMAAIETVSDHKITTIERLAPDRTHPLQQAWIAEQVPQCGYCQSGMLMTAAELLARKPKPTDEDIDAALGGHICRCGTYQRIRRAVHRAAESKGGTR